MRKTLPVADDSTKPAHPTPVRPTEASVRARMAEAGLAVHESDVSGVLANLIVLQDHVATLRGFALDARSASAMRFEA
jgi:hypothetical protein